jgi:2-polyprenyl-3-methyl-5-hydroxy-6-metoxy-1,4-benzoquinol methylase
MRANATPVDPFLETAGNVMGSRAAERLLRYYEHVLAGIPLRRSAALDVGGGAGELSFFLASRGAEPVICLEPAQAGSNAEMTAAFQRFASHPTLSVERRADTVQELSHEPFDVVVLHNSINHLDEPACRDLLHDDRARRTYDVIARKLFDLTRPGGHIVAADCSRHNIFSLVRRRNPLVPSIDWEAHQSPRTWRRIFADAGFVDPRVRWTSFKRLGRPGRMLFGNAVAAYFLRSHFVLVMRRPEWTA